MWRQLRTYALVIDDLDNGSESAGVGVVAVEEDYTANLDQAPLGGDDVCLTHYDGIALRALCQKDFLSE